MGTTFAVLGAGSWGTALAILLARNHHQVILWGRDPERMRVMVEQHRNPWYLPAAVFPEGMTLSAQLEAALAATPEVIIMAPSNSFRSLVERCAQLRPRGLRLAWGTKGLEPDTQRFLHEVSAEILGVATPTAVLSGPSFAQEVASGLPTALTVASRFPEYAVWLAQCLRCDSLRPYTTDDVIGVQLGGGLKNVLAIATGISDGLGLGANARAALVTRGLAEMMRLGAAMGARPETFMGLAGLGDLVLTCTDNLSRNRRFGVLIGQGQSPTVALHSIGQVVEGFATVRAAVVLAQRFKVDMPITRQVYAVLHTGHHPRAAVQELFARALRAETGD